MDVKTNNAHSRKPLSCKLVPIYLPRIIKLASQLSHSPILHMEEHRCFICKSVAKLFRNGEMIVGRKHCERYFKWVMSLGYQQRLSVRIGCSAVINQSVYCYTCIVSILLLEKIFIIIVFFFSFYFIIKLYFIVGLARG